MLRFLAILLMITAPCTAQQAAWDVDLELVLLADATGSIDNDEIMFQRLGYADAITDPLVLDAIVGGIYAQIAVAYVEWGDEFSQEVVVDWMIIDGPDSAAAFAERLMAPPRRAFGRNAIGAALLKGRDMIRSNAHRACSRDRSRRAVSCSKIVFRFGSTMVSQSSEHWAIAR